MPSFKNPHWKEELEFALSRGISLKSACKYAQVNINTVYKYGFKANDKIGIKKYHDTIVEMRKQGKNLNEISNAIGYGINSIFKYCKKQGIKKPRKLEIRY
jgi:DNA-binding CsgD family transcriptional regulator